MHRDAVFDTIIPSGGQVTFAWPRWDDAFLQLRIALFANGLQHLVYELRPLKPTVSQLSRNAEATEEGERSSRGLQKTRKTHASHSTSELSLRNRMRAARATCDPAQHELALGGGEVAWAAVAKRELLRHSSACAVRQTRLSRETRLRLQKGPHARTRCVKS
eukprot:2503952-Pleurochrysis_carterae.AAC.1